MNCTLWIIYGHSCFMHQALCFCQYCTSAGRGQKVILCTLHPVTFSSFVLFFDSGPAEQSTRRNGDFETAAAKSKYLCTHTSLAHSNRVHPPSPACRHFIFRLLVRPVRVNAMSHTGREFLPKREKYCPNISLDSWLN